MKITSINPAIITPHADQITAFYEKSFGFRVIHKGTLISTANPNETVRVLENEDGIRLDIVQLNSQKVSVHAIRVNVDDFEEGLAVYKAEGFSEISEPVVSKSSKRVLISKLDGAPILLMQHLK